MDAVLGGKALIKGIGESNSFRGAKPL